MATRAELIWSEVQHSLDEESRRWWQENRSDIIDLINTSRPDYVAKLAAAMGDGDLHRARVAIMAQMPMSEWQDYRDGVTQRLSEYARTRASLIEALKSLSVSVARIIGSALLASI